MTTYEFTITDGAVTALEAIDGDHSHYLRIPKDAVFTVGTGTITETLTGKGGVQTLTYVQSASDADIYALTSSTMTVTNPTVYAPNGAERGLAFTIVNGAVTAVAEETTVGGATQTHALKVAPTDSFAVTSDGITETRLHDNVIETVTFVQPAGEDLYVVSSVTDAFINAGSSTTQLSIHDQMRLSATISNGVVSVVQAISPSGAANALAAKANVTFTQPEAGYIVETITRGGGASYQVFHDGGGDGVYTEVAHGTGALDLVGLKAQIAQLGALEAVL